MCLRFFDPKIFRGRGKTKAWNMSWDWVVILFLTPTLHFYRARHAGRICGHRAGVDEFATSTHLGIHFRVRPRFVSIRRRPLFLARWCTHALTSRFSSTPGDISAPGCRPVTRALRTDSGLASKVWLLRHAAPRWVCRGLPGHPGRNRDPFVRTPGAGRAGVRGNAETHGVGTSHHPSVHFAAHGIRCARYRATRFRLLWRCRGWFARPHTTDEFQ